MGRHRRVVFFSFPSAFRPRKREGFPSGYRSASHLYHTHIGKKVFTLTASNPTLTPENIQTFLDEIKSHPNWETARELGRHLIFESPLGDVTHEEIAEHISGLLDLPLLGSGNYRAAYLYKGYALKLPITSHGRQDNERELTLWESVRADASLSEGLASCLGGDGEAMLFELASPIGKVTGIMNDRAAEWVARMRGKGISLLDCGNPQHRPRQWGLIDGHVVLLDYADYMRSMS